MATRRSFLVQLGLLGAGAAAVWLFRDKVMLAPPKVRFENGVDSGWLKFAARQPLIIVKATINGREVNALVDSGAQFSVLDRGFAQSFGPDATYPLPMMAYGVGGAPQVGRGITVDIGIGGMALREVRAAVLDLGPLAGEASLPIPLIIGQDVLHAVLADIDYPGRRIRFGDRERYALPEDATPAPVRGQGKALLAQVRLDGAPLEVIVDTGASAALSLTTDTAQAMSLLDGRPARTAPSVVLGGVTLGRIVEVERVEFAGVRLDDAEVHIFQSQPLPGFPKGLLGHGLLRRMRVVLDHGGGRMLIVGGYRPLTLGPRP